jgi:hypothetical protein
MRTLSSHIANYEELCTLPAEIEACLKSRTVWALSSDPFNLIYLSPGLFLIGEPLTQLPSADYTNVKCNRFSGWQFYQQQLQQFWQQWSFNYLQGLQQRQRWQRTSPNLQPEEETLSYWGRTIRHPSIGLQLSSPTYIQAKTASSAWSHLGTLR